MPKLLKIFLLFLTIIILYGFYEKDRRKQLYIDFKSNKPLLCDDGIKVRLSDGWMIHNNRFFTDGKVMKTIVFCKSVK
jgi:hypothetical protein